MRVRWSGLVVPVLMMVSLSGCVTDGIEESVTPTPLDVMRIQGTDVAVGEATEVAGSVLTADCKDPDECWDRAAPFWPQKELVPCSGRNCERIAFAIDAPTDLQVTATWPIQDKEYSGVGRYMGAPGLTFQIGVVPAGAADDQIVWSVSDRHGTTLLIEDLERGDYEIVTVIRWGEGDYTLTVLPLAGAPALSGELLPDLVVGPPRHLNLEEALGREAEPLLTATGHEGCGVDEIADEEAVRCLRFASDIGNVGLGYLELTLQAEEALYARGGADAAWRQIIHSADGTTREEAVSHADYHPFHGHYHIAAFAQSAVYAYDVDTDTRGEMVAQGGKTGFCVVSGGPLQVDRPYLDAGASISTACCYYVVFCEMDMVFAGDFAMGLAPGWFDIYPWWRSGQYVEVTGVPDGVYELVTSVNPEGNIIEADEANNQGGTIFRLEGDKVEIISAWTMAPDGTYKWSRTDGIHGGA